MSEQIDVRDYWPSAWVDLETVLFREAGTNVPTAMFMIKTALTG
jgi:hypothetical protein